MLGLSEGQTNTRILIIEGESMLAKELAESLNNLGYEILATVSTPEDALPIVTHADPDLILVGSTLQREVDGIEGAEQFLRRFDVPAIFLTDFPESDIVSLTRQTEPYGYVAKPFSPHVLRIIIEAALYKHKAEKRVREMQAKYRTLVEQVPAITYTAAFDGASTTLYVSPQIKASLGFSQDDYLADSDLWRKRLHPDDRERVMAEVAHSHETGEPFDSEYRILARDGRTVWFHDEAKLVFDEEGQPICLQGVMIDITERKRSAEALRSSEQRFRAVFENAAVGIDVLDSRGRFIELNSALAKMLGYSREELVELGPLDLTHPGDWKESKECLDRLVGGKIDSYRFAKRYLRRDGTILFADVMVSKILNSDGTYDCTVGVVADITDRKEAEEALSAKTQELGERVKELNCLYGISQLREQIDMSLEQTFQRVVDLIPPAWQYPEVACAKIIWEGQELKSQNLGDPVSKQSTNIVVHGEVVGSVEVAYVEKRPESDEGPFLKEERNLINAIAERLGRMLERTKAEEELQRYQARLEQLVQDRTMELVKANEQLAQEITQRKRAEEVLKQSASALERSNQDLEQFAYVAAHDLREPLVGVAAYLKLLERRSANLLDNEGKQYVSKALETVLRLDRLIRALLSYSRVSDKQQKSEPTDCGACLSQALSNLSMAIKECGATIKTDPMPTLMAIPEYMTQLFQNLIGNAIKFRGNLPLKIQVGVETRDYEHIFWVRDNGIGIERPYFDRIFQIFQRAENSANLQGTGIGLAACKKIVERHGGRIWVESEPGKGATFWFTLPTVGNPPALRSGGT